MNAFFYNMAEVTFRTCTHLPVTVTMVYQNVIIAPIFPDILTEFCYFYKYCMYDCRMLKHLITSACNLLVI